MASDLLEPQSSPAQTIPKHGPNSIAKRDYPRWDYPQQSFPPVMSWPFQVYEALPTGERGEHFFHVLTKIGITPPDLDKEYSPTFGDRVYNEIYDRTNGLLINRALGILVEDAESPRENRREFSVVILGFPGQIATDEQKKIVADLMGLSVESIVKVYAVNDY